MTYGGGGGVTKFSTSAKCLLCLAMLASPVRYSKHYGPNPAIRVRQIQMNNTQICDRLSTRPAGSCLPSQLKGASLSRFMEPFLACNGTASIHTRPVNRWRNSQTKKGEGKGAIRGSQRKLRKGRPKALRTLSCFPVTFWQISFQMLGLYLYSYSPRISSVASLHLYSASLLQLPSHV